MSKGAAFTSKKRGGGTMKRFLFLACLAFALIQSPPATAIEPAERLAVHLQSLESPKKETRREALQKIGELGRAAQPAVPMVLKCMLDDTEESVANQAARALAQIGGCAVP